MTDPEIATPLDEPAPEVANAPNTPDRDSVGVGPLGHRGVQMTLAGIFLLSVVWMAIAGGFSLPPQDAVEPQGRTLLRIDLNAADSRELALLPGVGPVLAQRIVANRDRCGDFRSIDELSRVHGIGEKTIARLGDVCEVRFPIASWPARQR